MAPWEPKHVTGYESECSGDNIYSELVGFLRAIVSKVHGNEKDEPFTDEAQTALFKDPVRTAL